MLGDSGVVELNCGVACGTVALGDSGVGDGAFELF